MIGRSAFVALILLCTAATAQVRPEPTGGDPRLQAVDYRRDQVVTIEGTAGYQITIALAPDEQVQNVAVGDSGAWQVSANRSGNLLFVKPVQDGIDTNMTVVTNARFYAFDLISARGDSSPYEVRFRYPEEHKEGALAETVKIPALVGRYRLSGSKALKPSGIGDDGEKTYIEWPEDAPLPAIFILDSGERERLANGGMRGNVYVIDSVHDRLRFRIDREKAEARRFVPKGDTP